MDRIPAADNQVSTTPLGCCHICGFSLLGRRKGFPMGMVDSGILAIWGDWTGLTFKQRSHQVLISETVFYFVLQQL